VRGRGLAGPRAPRTTARGGNALDHLSSSDEGGPAAAFARGWVGGPGLPALL